MRKTKYLSLLLVFTVLLTGCTKGTKEDKLKMSETFKKTEITSKMRGYKTHLVLTGKSNGKTISDLVYTSKYLNQVKIEMTDNTARNIRETENQEEPIMPEIVEKYTIYESGLIYYFDGLEYTKIESTYYYKPDNILKLLDNYKEIKREADTKVGKKTYPTYTLKVSKKEIIKSLSDTKINDIKLKKDIELKVYIKPDGTIWKIHMDLIDDIYITVFYNSFNSTREVKLNLK